MYQEQIKHYFDVCLIINTAIGENMEWDTSLDKLEIFETGFENERILNIKEACERFDITTAQAEAFFVVHCALSNYIYDLIDNKDYSTWSIENDVVKVLYDDGASKSYDIHAINALMTTVSARNDVKWTFDELTSYN